jgi:hypothetical protein
MPRSCKQDCQKEPRAAEYKMSQNSCSEPFKTRCYAVLKKLGGENGTESYYSCPVFVDLPDRKILPLLGQSADNTRIDATRFLDKFKKQRVRARAQGRVKFQPRSLS